MNKLEIVFTKNGDLTDEEASEMSELVRMVSKMRTAGRVKVDTERDAAPVGDYLYTPGW